MDISLAETLDDICTEMHDAGGRPMTSIHLAPYVYELVVTARRHRAAGAPLLLLGLDVVRDEELRATRYRIH
jgi:hypothetical protein